MRCEGPRASPDAERAGSGRRKDRVLAREVRSKSATRLAHAARREFAWRAPSAKRVVANEMELLRRHLERHLLFVAADNYIDRLPHFLRIHDCHVTAHVGDGTAGAF